VVISDWGCESAPSKLLEVNVHPLPKKPSIKVSPGLSICSGDTISLESDQAVGYIWSTGAITKSVSIFSEGDYHVKVTNEHGCSNFSDPLHIEFYPVPEVPLITASGPLTICSGDSVILKVGAGSEYIWSNGEKSSGISVKKPGNYSVRVKNSHGCLSETSPAVSVVVNALPQVSINSGEAVCINSAMEIAGVPTGGVFKVLDGAANIVNNLLIPSKLGNLLVEYTYTGLCSNSVTKNILVTDLPKAIPGPDQTLASSRDAKMQAALLPSERGEWALVSGSGEIWDIHSPVTQVSALGSGKNVFQWKVSKGDCVSVAEVTLTVDDFIIPSVITPNGDGENEFFYIDPAYGKVKLLIFNKWGRVEYQSDNYLNDWNGKSSKGVALPEDTYFCVLHFANGVVKKGSLLIKR
jgi:gliding motility-associated-like protein